MNKMRYLRIAVAAAVLVAVFACTFAHVPVGTLCALCPVGFFELAATGGAVPWGLLPGVLVLLALVFALGRVFCSWVCPTSLLKNVFGGKAPRGLTGRTGSCAGCVSAGAGAKAGQGRVVNNLAAQGIVLVVLLLVSFAVHFPVFCLFCPIGLTFGTLFAISRMFVTWQPGWELVVFPAMLLAELFLLKRWCSAICPLGFFFGLMAKARSRIGILPRVRVNRGTCLHDSGCEVCATVCPDNLSAPDADGRALEDCTLCLDCREHCPAKSISYLSVSAQAPSQDPLPEGPECSTR